MLYILLTIILCSLGAFTFIPKYKGVVKRHSVGINFFLTLVATLVGVLLAISITNYEEKQKEKRDLIKLLKSSMTSVETCYEYSQELIEYFDQLSNEDDLKSTFYLKNPPPYPDYLDALVMQTIVSKNLSGATLSDLNEYLINLKRAREKDATLYLQVLEQTLKLLKLEVAFQQGHINAAELEIQLTEITF